MRTENAASIRWGVINRKKRKDAAVHDEMFIVRTSRRSSE